MRDFLAYATVASMLVGGGAGSDGLGRMASAVVTGGPAAVIQTVSQVVGLSSGGAPLSFTGRSAPVGEYLRFGY